MKNLIEHMATTVVMTLILLVFCSVLTAEVQINNAKKIHASAVAKVQSSYFSVSEDELNDALHNTYKKTDKAGKYYWNIELEDKTTIEGRKTYLVTLDYVVEVPLLSIEKKGTIEGYAR